MTNIIMTPQPQLGLATKIWILFLGFLDVEMIFRKSRYFEMNLVSNKIFEDHMEAALMLRVNNR